MPIILHDEPKNLRWCQECYICGRYRRAEPRTLRRPYNEGPRAVRRDMWAVPCPSCSGNHPVEDCDKRR
eukprot:9978838-Alexandrium_andersonii.AAC.1